MIVITRTKFVVFGYRHTPQKLFGVCFCGCWVMWTDSTTGNKLVSGLTHNDLNQRYVFSSHSEFTNFKNEERRLLRKELEESKESKVKYLNDKLQNEVSKNRVLNRKYTDVLNELGNIKAAIKIIGISDAK